MDLHRSRTCRWAEAALKSLNCLSFSSQWATTQKVGIQVYTPIVNPFQPGLGFFNITPVASGAIALQALPRQTKPI